MTDDNLRQLRILHVVSSGGVPNGLQQELFMPLLTRMPKQRVKSQVVALAPGVVPGSVLRQIGIPTYDVPLSRQRFSLGGYRELLQAVKAFRPDVIQVWGHTAQIVANRMRKSCDWRPRVVWSVAETAPLPAKAGFIDRQKLKLAAKASHRADRIVYTSQAGAAHHRRVGYPEDGHVVVAPGVDATRFKPDFATRRKVREQLSLPPEAFVIGMVAPCVPESDHASLFKAAGELFKTNPNIALVLAGHGVQRGNAPLMAMVGGGPLGARTQLLGEWSDVASLFNACDVVCSSALSDAGRMTLVKAMLCGVPCVATGMGAQGEVVGQFGVAVEPGSPAALVRGITRVMQLTPEKRAYMAQGARKHALANFVYVRSLQKYLQLYYDLLGRQSLVTEDVPTPEIDASVPVQQPLPPKTKPAVGRNAVSSFDLSDPDSLENKVQPAVGLPAFAPPPEPVQPVQAPPPQNDGDVLTTLELALSKNDASGSDSPISERARGVAEELEDLLAPEVLAGPVAPLRAPTAADKKALPKKEVAEDKAARADTAKSQAASKMDAHRNANKMAARTDASKADAPRAADKAGMLKVEAPKADVLRADAPTTNTSRPIIAATMDLFEVEAPQANNVPKPPAASVTETPLQDSLQLDLLPEPLEAPKRALAN